MCLFDYILIQSELCSDVAKETLLFIYLHRLSGTVSNQNQSFLFSPPVNLKSEDSLGSQLQYQEPPLALSQSVKTAKITLSSFLPATDYDSCALGNI